MRITKDQIRKIIHENADLTSQPYLKRIRDAMIRPQLASDEMIEHAFLRKTLGNKAIDEISDKFGISYGLAADICQAVKSVRSLMNYTAPSHREARLDRLLRTRSSTGRATARKFS
jgi:hypothetical protein